jgi:hypothetical protein
MNEPAQRSAAGSFHPLLRRERPALSIQKSALVPPPPGSIGIIGLGENRRKVYVAQDFTGKIFKTLSLWVPATSGYFSAESCKILDLQELLTGVPLSWLQNLDFAGLARKILQNIDLAQPGATLILD